MENENTVGYGMGVVSSFLAECKDDEEMSVVYRRKGGERALEYYEKVEKKFREWRAENLDLREEVARLGQAAQHKPTKEAEPDYRNMVSLEFNDSRTVCLVYVHPEDGEPFGCGAAYRNDFMQVELESPPFKVALTLPYLRAVYRALEERAHELPVGRSSSL